jgi:hypothetical protein
MKRAMILTTLLVALLIGGLCCQKQTLAGDPPIEPTTSDEPVTDVIQPPDVVTPEVDPGAPTILSLGDLTIDLDDGSVSFPATVCLRRGMLEALVCKAGTKEHESVLSTTVAPSMVHAGLLSLGLTPGLPARWIDLQDGSRGVSIPPRGGQVLVEFSWEDAEGAIHSARAGQWLTARVLEEGYVDEDAGEDAELSGSTWVFVGSDLMANGVYWADGSGDLISLSNFPSTVLDVPFESTDSNEGLLYQANTEAIPPEGTEVTVTLTPLPDAAESPYVRKWVFVDAMGDATADGAALAVEELTEWGMTLVNAHPRAQVVVWLDPAVTSHRTQQVWEALRVGGVYDIREVREATAAPWLPLSASQQEVLLADINERFEYPKDYYVTPQEHSQGVLDAIEVRRAELARQEALLAGLEAEIETLMEASPVEDASDEGAE